MEMEQTILDAIKNILPNAQFDAVAKAFDELKEANKSLVKAVEHIKNLEKENANLRAKEVLDSALKGRKIELDRCESKLRDDQHALELGRVRCEMHKEMVIFAKDIVSTVFRNTQVKRSMFGNAPGVLNENGYVNTVPVSTEVTETQE